MIKKEQLIIILNSVTLPRSDNFVPFAELDETNSDAHVFLSIYFNKFYDLTQSDIDAFVEYQKQFLGKRKVLIRIGPEMNGKTTKKN